MRPVLAQLVELLTLERIEADLFRGQSQDLGWGAIFGGQVLGQALSAAAQTVPEERSVHSLHGYFLRQGDASAPVVYEVDRIRNGRSFTTRRVVAIQGGRAIFNMSASFQVSEEGMDHQMDLDLDVPAPEELASEQELARAVADRIPERMRKRALAERPIEARVVNPMNPFAPRAAPPRKQVWYRAVDPLVDDERLHRYLLAYASDFHFLTTALYPHGKTLFQPGLQMASLDHAMWFHRPFRFDEWLLHVIESPNATGARGLVLGRFYDRQGRLVASTAQEGLMRQWAT
ncbi:MAG: acyl-CoA thioesterase II [Myxococcales bacterium]|nr:acyl-CoA thioesterase II [Myxococcales bacterium]